MQGLDERLAGLRQAAGSGSDWGALEQAVMAGIGPQRARQAARWQLAWTGALALGVGLVGSLGGGRAPAMAAGPQNLPVLTLPVLALPVQAPSAVLLGVR
jgi:hypothetical protein